jgi:Holliday junction resolvase RusA-like endonuclease
MVEMSKAVGPWREAVRAETQLAVGRDLPLGGPVAVTLMFYLARPAGHFRTGRNAHLLRPRAPEYPAGRPDLDKLARAVLDGLTMGGAWKDDSQVWNLHAQKVYAIGDRPGCIIDIVESIA